MIEVSLRHRARESIRTGRLPRRRPQHVWGGSAFGGRRCAVCGDPIQHEEIALEVEFPAETEAASTEAHLHTRCFLAFELELLRETAPPAAALGERAASLAGGLRPSRPAANVDLHSQLPMETTGAKIAPYGRVGS